MKSERFLDFCIPLLDKIAIDVNRVWLTQIVRNELDDVFQLGLIFECRKYILLAMRARHVNSKYFDVSLS
jgi:hypothetical protein